MAPIVQTIWVQLVFLLKAVVKKAGAFLLCWIVLLIDGLYIPDKVFCVFLMCPWSCWLHFFLHLDFSCLVPTFFGLCIYIPMPVNLFSVFWINHFFHYRSMKWSCFKQIVCLLQKLLSLLCWDCLNWCPCRCFFEVLWTFLNSLFSETYYQYCGFWNTVSGSPLYLFCCFPFFLSYSLWTMLFHGHFHPSCIPLAWYKWFLSLVKLSPHFGNVSRF